MSGADTIPPPAGYQAVYTQQPAGSGDRFGVTPGAGAPGITVRPLRDTHEDADFAGRMIVEAFRGKILYTVGKRKSGADFNDLGCWAGFGLVRLGVVLTEKVGRGKCYLDHIAVDEGFRGKGIGKVLMEKAEYEARMRGCSMIYLYVVSTNRAKILYERQGYVVTSEDNCCYCLECCLGEKSVYCMEEFRQNHYVPS